MTTTWGQLLELHSHKWVRHSDSRSILLQKDYWMDRKKVQFRNFQCCNYMMLRSLTEIDYILLHSDIHRANKTTKQFLFYLHSNKHQQHRQILIIHNLMIRITSPHTHAVHSNHIHIEILTATTSYMRNKVWHENHQIL